jgi:hypothetical protein
MNNISTSLLDWEEKDRINGVCKEYGINNYTINRDGSIDVDGDFYLDVDMIELHLKFNRVSGSFFCSNLQLTSLEGGPSEVGGDFFCNGNALTSLMHCPKVVGGNFYCFKNNLPIRIMDYFNDDTSNKEEKHIFLKYQSYYDVWTPEFNLDGFNELIAEIKDGLR